MDWPGGSALTLHCEGRRACIDYRQLEGGEDRRGQLRDTSLLPGRAEDLPKLRDALRELHRLCDDAYRVEDAARCPPGGQPPCG
ncbi:MAG TPA: hypothetical protein VFV27_12510 [Nevskiaceae bacterium]|nr:hypothetical protein [Nevskiaceae bacterium]